jgi:regulatory protein
MTGSSRARAHKEHSHTDGPEGEGSGAAGTGLAAATDIGRMAVLSASSSPNPGAATTKAAAAESSVDAHAAVVSETARAAESPARELALRFLDRRTRTREELLAHLRQRGVPDELSESIICRFQETGLIDDQGLAERWVASRQAAKSARQLQAELVRRGVDRDVAASAARVVGADVEEAAMLKLINRRALAMGGLPVEVKQRRLMAQLARRGYPADAARRCVQRALGDPGEEALDDGRPPPSGGPDFLDQV